jgi:uncharacterized protein (TIGR00661 family)
MNKGKKYLLVVQGEGRGHLTQALTMHDLLIEKGHTVCAVIVGSSDRREIPNFFFEKIKAPVIRLESPNFVTDKSNKSVKIFKTVIHNFRRLGTFRGSLKAIDEILEKYQPDVVINFFDLLMGLYHRFYKPKSKMVCIAHQYIYFHPDFEFPPGYLLDRMAIKFYTKLTSIGSCKNIALSFYNIYTHSDDVTIVPPLLRNEVYALNSTQKDHYLVYLVNNGYYEEIIAWHKSNPGVELHCFTDSPETLLGKYSYRSQNMHLHAINDKLFLEKMSEARGLASSAGFESVCEAMYLGKPVLMVPVAGHFEQYCNSRDAAKAGAGIFDNKFDLSRLTQFKQEINGHHTEFKAWVENARHRIYSEIISV